MKKNKKQIDHEAKVRQAKNYQQFGRTMANPVFGITSVGNILGEKKKIKGRDRELQNRYNKLKQEGKL